MNPISPEQILRNLDHGFTMTRQQQAEAAQYIRQLQQAVLDEREWVGLTDDEVKESINNLLEDDPNPLLTLADVIQERLKEKNT